MPTPTNVRDILHEKLDALLDDCDTVMDNAAFGQIIHDLDDFLFVEGKKFTKEVLQEKLQEHIGWSECVWCFYQRGLWGWSVSYCC
jgi:hypothetical protein